MASLTTTVGVLWLAWLVIWFAAALNVKRTRVRDTAFSRFIHFVFAALVFSLMFHQGLPLGALDGRFIPRLAFIEVLGVSLTAAGLVFSIWARVCLGRNWSGTVRISQGHELIRSGPYARIRHPIYSGLLLAFAGTALVMGSWRGIFASAVAVLGLAIKATREERMLAQEFGPAFVEHRRRTGFFFPKVSQDYRRDST